MFVTSEDYKFQVEKIIQKSDSVDIAVAFWGKGAEKLFEKIEKPIRILCNLTSGGTNPEPIEKLYKNIEIRHLNDLHAKVVIGDKSAIVGSANFSTNGLNIEDGEFDGWQEAGFVTDDEVSLAKMSFWFEQQWNRGQVVDGKLLEKARLNWKKRREGKIDCPDDAISVLDMKPEALSGTDIFLAIFSEDSSPEATRENQEQHDNLISKTGAVNTPAPYFFEGWDEKKLSEILLGYSVISVYVGPKGGVSVVGAYKVVRESMSSIGTKLHICENLSSLRGLPFGGKQKRDLGERIRECVKDLKPDDSSVLMPLDKFLAKYWVANN